MNTVLERCKVQINQRPAYTRYELGNLVKIKRENEFKTQKDFADEYNIDLQMLINIESANRAFNVPMYKACSKILKKPISELTAMNIDTNQIDFRATELNEDVEKTVMLANKFFNEIIMQHKLSVR